jgi:hypothetical protein
METVNLLISYNFDLISGSVITYKLLDSIYFKTVKMHYEAVFRLILFL